MSQRCYLCGKETLFYIWTSSRNFPREKFIEITGIPEKIVQRKGFAVCYHCYQKLLNDEI